MKINEEYDYIILGAGSAGCVLANKLSESGADKVLLLEAGPMDRKLLIHMPAGVYSVFKDPSINWNYDSETEPECNDRNITLPRGKVIGGSSSINSMVYMRGHPKDYDGWAEKFALPDWQFRNCLPYFKACESSDRGADDWRGANGPLGVTKGKLENPLFDAMLLAGEQSGAGVSEDLNGFKPEGIARLDSTVKNGRRCSAAVAHLYPALKRSNLKLLTRALVHRIEISGGKATGVTFSHQGLEQTLQAHKGVIVSCGAIKTPQVLMLSGIGPADHLQEHDIEVKHHLPGVGQNLQDHLSLDTAFHSKKAVTLDYLSNPINKARVGLQWILTRKGVVASNIWEMGGLVFGNQKVEFPNLQYHFTPVYSEYEGIKINLFQGYQINVDQLRPKSKGHIRLISNNPEDRPAAQFNYLSDSHDLNEMVEAHHVMQDLMRQPAFDEFRGERILPEPDVSTRAEIEAYIRATTSTDYHPSCSCRMGNDEMAVVDSKLNVHGIEHLHVVDASVMPDIVSGNLNAPTQMIALRAADFIRGKQGLPPEDAKYHFQ